MEQVSLEQILFAAAYLAAIVFCGIICGLVFVRILVSLKKHDLFSWFHKVPVDHLRGPLLLLFPVGAYFIATYFYRPEALKTAPFAGTVKIIMVFAFAWLAARAVHATTNILAMQFDISVGDNLRARRAQTQIFILRRIINAIIFIIALAIVFLMSDSLSKVGVSLLTSAGIAGIILGFAAQRVLGNFLAGIQIALTQPIRLDDVVVIEGEWGRIEEITLTYVVVNIWDQRRLVVPISYFIEKPIQNWTRKSADILNSANFFVDYTVPVPALRDYLIKILQLSPLWDKRVGVLQVVDCTPEAMEIRALMSARNSSEGWDLRCEVREKMIEFITANYPNALPKNRAEIRVESKN
ncbi:MAG: mechanosensitive ion channel [Alphaproteobacteria bacterium]|nr:MAG: mechanosensitive ion channel [Alphaproteobacteria bacterium]